MACKLFSMGEAEWTFSKLAGSISMSASETHEATERCKKAGILGTPRGKLTVVRKRFFELLTLSVPQVFYAVRGQIGLGVTTSVYATPLAGKFPSNEDSLIPLVWPYAGGTVKGESLLPIYPTVPKAVQHDNLLYELLSLVDVVRTGSIKERKLAADLLDKLIWRGERKSD